MNSKAKSTNSKSGIGVGSASVVLIFAVLCLTIFTLITYITASNYKALVDAEAELVTAYYKADGLAVVTLDTILQTGARDIVTNYGIEVKTAYDETLGLETTTFYCPLISQTDEQRDLGKVLFVNIHFGGDSYDILDWRMVDTDDWISDGGINIWPGG